MAWYKTGTVAVTNNSTTVTGSGTTWAVSIAPGDLFSLDGTKVYEVESVNSNTSLSLATPWTGSTLTGQAYAVARLSTVAISTVTLANKLSGLLTNWQVRENEFITWHGGSDTAGYRIDGTPANPATTDPQAGYYPLTRLDGVVVYVACPAKLSDPNNLSTVVPVNKGGTGSATQNFADLTTNQTIGGNKTFTLPVAASITGNAATVTNGVYTTGNQTIAGNKTFSGTVVTKQLIITNDGTATDVNNIGTPGGRGFGVGICPGPLPSGMAPVSSGTFDKFHDDYGNYIYTDGSIMCWIPAYYYKWGTGSNGLSVNAVSIQPLSAYADEATANAAGYALDRAFYDGGVAQKGVFVDKFQCSNNGGVASSIRNGNPLSSNSAHNAFSGLTGAPANYYYGAIAAAKTRGSSFFCNSRFIFAMLARLAYAHAKASTSTTYCGWYHATNNFPKGCNNNALMDVNDTSVIYVSDGYSTCGKTGSANYFNRTTHNGQNSGVADLNGNMWEVTPGLTSDGTKLYILNTSVAMKNVTGGNTLATDLWGATGIAALYTSLGTTYQSLTDSDTAKYYGSTSQVFSAATSGNDWAAAGLGIPLLAGTGGTNAFGSDGLWDYAPSGKNELCPLSGGHWSNSSSAGVWAFYLNTVRVNSVDTVGFRSALYL